MSRARWLLALGALGLLAAGGGLWLSQGETVWMEQILAFCL